MGISAHIAWLRAAAGHDLLLLPSVSVLPVDQAGRLLLVRHAGHHDGWAVLGGAVEVGESPAEAAVRETREEIGLEVRLVRLLVPSFTWCATNWLHLICGTPQVSFESSALACRIRLLSR